ncbi:MAG: PilN domain-containing protein [Candidatus Wallbacteria bacterium]|nr:PilN domain-containing protein [Candidatus Wallbacteria bacterium]
MSGQAEHKTIEISLQAGRCVVTWSGAGRQAELTTGTPDEPVEARVESLLREAQPELIRVRFSPCTLQATTRGFTELPIRSSEATLFLDRMLERELGAAVLSRRLGRHVQRMDGPSAPAPSATDSLESVLERRGRSRPAASGPPRFLVIETFAEMGLPARVLEAVLQSGCERVDAVLQLPPSIPPDSDAAVLALCVEPERSVLGLFRAGLPPLAVRPLPPSFLDEPAPGAADALVAAARELLARVAASAFPVSALHWDAPPDLAARVLPRIRALGRALGLEAAAVPASPGAHGPRALPFTLQLKRPPFFLARWLRDSPSRTRLLQRLLPVSLVLALAAQAGVVLTAGKELARLAGRIDRLAGMRLPSHSRSAVPHAPSLATRAREVSELAQALRRSLEDVLSNLEPLVPDDLRLTAVELSGSSRVRISGHSRQPGSLTLFFSRLQQCPAFRRVRLVSEARAREGQGPSQQVLAFTFEGALEPSPKRPSPKPQTQARRDAQETGLGR